MRSLRYPRAGAVAETELALSGPDLAHSVYNAYRQASLAVGHELPAWQDLNPGQHEAWFRVAMDVDADIARAGDEASARNLASVAHLAFGGHSVAYGEEPLEVQLCWEAAVRHLVNMQGREGDDEKTVPEHEEYWKGWLPPALARRQDELKGRAA